MLPIITYFNGDPEKFYPQFYKAFSSTENLYKNLSGNCSLLLSFEAAKSPNSKNHWVSIHEDVLSYDIEEAENFSEMDLSFWLCFWNNLFFHKKILVCIASNACHF